MEHYQRTGDKEQVHIRLDADIVEHFRSGGSGWQTRLNETLRQAVFGQVGDALQVPERRPCTLAPGVAADHAAALFPTTLAFDLVGGRAVLGHAPGPLWPLKNSQSANPAALAMAFTRRAIWDSDSPNTFPSPPTPAGRMASRAFIAMGVMATMAPWARRRSWSG